MPKLPKTIVKLARRAISPAKKVKLYIKQQFGWLNQPIIQPFRGFGNNQIVHVAGRVLEDNGLARAASRDNIWSNIIAMLKRFISDEIPGVEVKIRFYEFECVTKTNEAGIFSAEILITDFDPDRTNWHHVEIELLDEVVKNQGVVKATGEVLIEQGGSQYGVISDVDDTIMISHATRTMRKLRLFLLKNARSRLPFEGVASFYRALHQGAKGDIVNPIFFVSSSEWNLYDLLVDFCETRDIPKAPFLLRKLKTNIFQLLRPGKDPHLHKLDKIEKVLNTYRDKKFILIGDSGQHDAHIYARVLDDFPGRILAIYIRDVKRSKHSMVKKIGEEVKTRHGVDMLLVQDTQAAARHAVLNNYIEENWEEEVRKEKAADQKAGEWI